MDIFDNNPYRQQQKRQQALTGLLDGLAHQEGSLGALLGSTIAQQQGSLSQRQPFGGDYLDALLQRPKFKRYESPLTFIDKLRVEIDNWLKS